MTAPRGALALVAAVLAAATLAVPALAQEASDDAVLTVHVAPDSIDPGGPFEEQPVTEPPVTEPDIEEPVSEPVDGVIDEPRPSAQAEEPVVPPEASVPIRSATVSHQAVTFDHCETRDGTPAPALVLPCGTCWAEPVVVTNGDAPARLDVQASDLAGNAGGAWRLVDAARPGTDEARLVIAGDAACGPSEYASQPCATEPGEATTVHLGLVGPAATTNPSLSFTTTIVWSALP